MPGSSHSVAFFQLLKACPCGTFSGLGRGGFPSSARFPGSLQSAPIPISFLSCIDAHHVLEKCVYLPKMAFLAARGGRGRGVACSACSDPACCSCIGFDFLLRGALPLKSARSRAARLAQLGRFWVRDACRDLAEFLDTFAGSQRASAFACVSVPAGCRGVVTP